MKKLIFFIVILAAIVVGIFFLQRLNTRAAYQDIDLATYKQKIEKKESFVLYVYSPTCKYCEQFRPTLNEIIEKNSIVLYGLNTSSTENRDKDLVRDGTPALIVFQDGKEVKRNIGFDGDTPEKKEKSREETLEFLRKHAPFLKL